jgi:hypothetical protein
MFRNIIVLVLLLLVSSYDVYSHEESGPWSCETGSEIHVESEFQPGVITLDGHADDWKDIDGSHFSLLLALDPDAENEFNGGKMTVKVFLSLSFCYSHSSIYLFIFLVFVVLLQSVHDGRDIFFLLQVDGDYAYSNG